MGKPRLLITVEDTLAGQGRGTIVVPDPDLGPGPHKMRVLRRADGSRKALLDRGEPRD